MKRLFLILSIFAAFLLTGCGTSSEMLKHSETMYDKQIAATQKAVPTPILQIVARPGQTMEFKGVASISVYNPASESNMAKVPEYKLPEDPFAQVANKIIDKGSDLVFGTLGFKLKLGEQSRSIGAADKDLLLRINEATTFTNPFK